MDGFGGVVAWVVTTNRVIDIKGGVPSLTLRACV